MQMRVKQGTQGHDYRKKIGEQAGKYESTHTGKGMEQTVISTNLRVAQTLSALIALLAGVAASGGLFMPGLYREPVEFIAVLQGQDLVTLLVTPFLVAASIFAGRGSVRAKMVWVGLLGYVLYTYAGASVGYFFNRFFLIYMAIFSMSAFALVFAVRSIDIEALRKNFDTATPRKPVMVFMLLIAFMLAALELGQNLAYLATGTIPEMIIRSGGITSFVYAFDMGLIVPLTLLSAVCLWRREPWGYLLAGIILIKGATMGLALLSMDLFITLAGYPSDGLEKMWAVIAFGSLGLAVWFYRHCRN